MHVLSLGDSLGSVESPFLSIGDDSEFGRVFPPR